MSDTWSHFCYNEIKVKCPRESWKAVRMQLIYDVYQNGKQELSPFMRCHNEYGLSYCFECKQKLYKYLTSLQEDTIFNDPIDLQNIL